MVAANECGPVDADHAVVPFMCFERLGVLLGDMSSHTGADIEAYAWGSDSCRYVITTAILSATILYGATFGSVVSRCRIFTQPPHQARRNILKLK
jgi:hypothetical protein